MAEIDEEIVDVLAAAGLSLTKAVNAFCGEIQPAGGVIPGKAVFVKISGGAQSIAFCDGGRHSNVKRVSVQVIVRGEAGEQKWGTGQSLAKAARAACHEVTLPLGVGFGCIAQESAPIYLGLDRQGHPMWSFNLLALREE